MHSKGLKKQTLNKTSISNKSVFYVVGVMSGTSLDGIDLCYVRFEQAESWKFKIIDAKTVDYPKQWQERLQNAITLSASKLVQINNDYTYFLSKVISNFIKQHPKPTIDAICSHGHTIFHQPNLGRTLQIGNLPILSNYLNQTVVCDFRTQDISLGGQGAPLVPVGDALLFPQYDYCINLGGFANISYEDLGDDWPEKAAISVAKGKICALFHGQMEFGPRALGNRSIIANPMLEDTRQKINSTIKRRPSYQPFCPSILEEERERLFNNSFSHKHMAIAFRMKDEFIKDLPCAVHIDGTARPQFVEEKDNPNFYRYLKELKNIMGYGVSINTSFNLHGRTIVRTPKDAVVDFIDCNIDELFIEGYCVKRKYNYES